MCVSMVRCTVGTLCRSVTCADGGGGGGGGGGEDGDCGSFHSRRHSRRAEAGPRSKALSAGLEPGPSGQGMHAGRGIDARKGQPGERARARSPGGSHLAPDPELRRSEDVTAAPPARPRRAAPQPAAE